MAIKSYSSGCSCNAKPGDAPKSPVGREFVSVQRPDQVSLELRLAGVVGVC
jgi:hypothetical protein